jgi:hypothetical protein
VRSNTYNGAAEKLKRLDSDIDKTFQELAKNEEESGEEL